MYVYIDTYMYMDTLWIKQMKKQICICMYMYKYIKHICMYICVYTYIYMYIYRLRRGGKPYYCTYVNSRCGNVFVKSMLQSRLATGCICFKLDNVVFANQSKAELYSSRLAVYPTLQVYNTETFSLYLVLFGFWDSK